MESTAASNANVEHRLIQASLKYFKLRGNLLNYMTDDLSSVGKVDSSSKLLLSVVYIHYSMRHLSVCRSAMSYIMAQK